MTAAPALLLTPVDLERLIQKLPAEQRARVGQAPERLREMLDRMLEDDRGEVIHAVAAECVRECLPLLEDAALRRECPRNFEEQSHKLLEYFQGCAAAESVEWTCGALALLWANERELPSWESMELLARVKFDWPIYERSRSPIEGLLEAYVMLLALLRALERGIPREQVEELADRAYLTASGNVELLSARGVDLNPLRRLSPEQRFQKLLQAIKNIQGVMTDEDADIILSARVRGFF